MKSKQLQKNKIKQTQKEDWWLFCDNFLKISELACKEMIHQEYSMGWSKQKGHVGPKEFWPHNLYISAIYNLKHSIEIFLKYFLIIIEDKFPEVGKDGHNIEKYLDLFQDKYKLDLINKEIKKAYKDKKDSRYSLDTAEMETQFSEEWFNNIASISLKYFKCEDLKEKIKFFDLKDVSNTCFKYPKNDLSIELNYSEIINQITKEDIKKVLNDIYELKNAFNSLRFLIEVYYDIKE